MSSVYSNLEPKWLTGEFSTKTCLSAIVLIVLVAVGVLFTDWLLRADTIPVSQVSFEGEFNHVSKPALEKAVMQHMGTNFLVLDIDAIKTSVAAIPWVYEVSVRRKWPFGVHISFVEQDITAQWNDGMWLNRYGDAVELGAQYTNTSLPKLSGPENTHSYVLEQYRVFTQTLASVNLNLRQLNYTERRTWDMTMGNGMSLILSRQNMLENLTRFVQIYPQVFAKQGDQIKKIDLRYTNGLAVEWRDHQKPTSQNNNIEGKG